MFVAFVDREVVAIDEWISASPRHYRVVMSILLGVADGRVSACSRRNLLHSNAVSYLGPDVVAPAPRVLAS